MHLPLRLVLPVLVIGLGGIACGDEASPIPNTAPTVSGPTVQAASVTSGTPVAMTLEASDADGDALTYTWTQLPASPAGTFDDPSAAQPSWTAPDVDSTQSFTLKVSVSDGRGGSSEGAIDVTVRKTNQPPTVSVTAPTSLVAGAIGMFSVTASDPDGDPLTYAWTQSAPSTPGTWLGSTTGESAQWYSPVVATQTAFTFSVSVSDGVGLPVVRTVTLPVSVPRYGADVQALWNSVECTKCHGKAGNLSLAAGSSHASLINVAARACGSLQRVTPGDPDHSALIQKMEGTGCGDRMPASKPEYFDQHPGLNILVRSWILAGAAND
ncbi:Ig-like domain-containing protein [Corallococcus exercitus]|uniref:Ig-like domain-containing protein n=1 Tax=Corallococcus exercitus TaxID=2316736 RepID=UPI000EA3093A|nr:Ig-like domain-containing protein [Corallococcus exercitus]